MGKRFDREAMLNLPHADVRARYHAMFGEAPRSPNKTWMVNQMEERHAARKAGQKAARSAQATADGAASSGTSSGRRRSGARRGDAEIPEPQVEVTTGAAPADDSEATSDGVAAPSADARERGRFRGMTVEELRTLYEQKIGRATSSTDKPYLIWKLTQAEKGKIRVGPVVHGQRLEGSFAGNDRTLPLTMTAAAVAAIDAAWPRAGFTSRMSFMRAAIRELLVRRGETKAAAHFPDKGTA